MKLSIITINYNNLAGLKKTVDSVLSQTWRDFEWIIVDGGSNDGSKEYIETLAQSLSEGTAIDSVQWCVEHFSLPGFTAENLKDQQLEETSDHSSAIDNRPSPIDHRQSIIANRSQRFLWCSEPDKGVYNAMNKGIAMAQGEYLNFMNSGDCFCLSTTLSQVQLMMNDCNEGILFGDVYFQNIDGKVIIHKYSYSIGLESYLRKSFINHQSSFIRKELLIDHPYDESFMISADTEFFMHCLVKGESFLYMDIPVAVYQLGGLSSSDLDRCHRDEDSAIAQNLVDAYLPKVFSILFRFYRKNIIFKFIINLLFMPRRSFNKILSYVK